MSATKTELEARIEELEEEKEELQDRLDQIAGLSVPQEEHSHATHGINLTSPWSLPTRIRPAIPTNRPLSRTPGIVLIACSIPAGSSMPSGNAQSTMKLWLSVTSA